MTEAQLPGHFDFLTAALHCFQQADGSMTNEESVDQVIEHMGLTEEQQAIPHRTDGAARGSRVANQVAWARTNLKRIGLLKNVDRAVWTITPEGRDATPQQATDLLRELRRQRRLERSNDEAGEDGAAPDDTWQDELLQVLGEMPPDAFERLCGQILRKSGFVNVDILGRPNDGGIDGVGVYRLSLVSFRVYFQCKRYSGAVRAHAVRDFRGAMAGRGDQGLLITTSHFTREAEHEAERDGAPPIELVDGERLCELMLEHRIGLAAAERIEYDVTVKNDYFASI